jgi:NADH pyrophosphatase NudC (nudix superfamily)
MPTKGRNWFERKVRELGDVLRRLPRPRQRVLFDASRPTCPTCGQRFDPVRAGQKYCRPSCKARGEAKRTDPDLFDGKDAA